jgi:pyruvate dehydrogenase E1 component
MTNRIANDAAAEFLAQLERKVLWLSCWTIHHANHLRAKIDGLKVGGHQASCASSVSLLTALYFSVLRPQDRVAVKPHAAPVFHAIQYLLGRQSREQLENFRAFGGAQSYPSRTKDIDDVDFSTGSVGLGVAFTAFASIVQDYVRAKSWAKASPAETPPEGRMIALVGDAELDEGNIYECLQEGWKQGLRNTWWIIDYNRQSLDGVVREGLYDRIEDIFRAFGWDVVTLKHGKLQRRIFAEPGGAALRDWIDNCPNSLYAALTFQGGTAWRRRLGDELREHADTLELLRRLSDDELARCMQNLGGHCLPTILEAFLGIDHDRPVVFIAYTIKGWGTPLAGHKDNHAGLMSPDQMAAFQQAMGVPVGCEWEPFAGAGMNAAGLEEFLAAVPFNRRRKRRAAAAPISVPAHEPVADITISTQAGFGRILDGLARGDSALADRIVTMSPDVTVSTNLGPWVNRRNLFARSALADTFRDERIPSAQKWRFAPDGQHLELGIAEMNLFLLLGAAGLSHSLFDERLFPIGTLYDPFISRGLDALNYACYQGARFMMVATPSGVSLAPEGGAHQSIATPLIGMSQDGLASFEPAFVDELGLIMDWSFDYMQRDGEGDSDEHSWLRDETGGAVYLRLSTRPLEQPRRDIDTARGRAMIDGAYWMREPGPNCEVAIAYQGTVASEAIAAAGMIGEYRRDVGVLAVTSADRLHAGWQAAARARRRGTVQACSHVERLLAPLPPHCTIVSVIDGHPATLSWLGGVRGHRTLALGVEHFGQSGSVPDLYRHVGIDAEAIANAVATEVPGRSMPLRRPSIRIVS